MQVDPIKPNLKAPGNKRLKLIYHGPLSNFAFNFNLRRYTAEGRGPPPAAALGGRAAAAGRAAGGGGGRLEMDIEISDDSDDEVGGNTRQGSVKGLTLVHFSAQREHFSSHVVRCFASFSDKNGSG